MRTLGGPTPSRRTQRAPTWPGEPAACRAAVHTKGWSPREVLQLSYSLGWHRYLCGEAAAACHSLLHLAGHGSQDRQRDILMFTEHCIADMVGQEHCYPAAGSGVIGRRCRVARAAGSTWPSSWTWPPASSSTASAGCAVCFRTYLHHQVWDQHHRLSSVEIVLSQIISAHETSIQHKSCQCSTFKSWAVQQLHRECSRLLHSCRFILMPMVSAPAFSSSCTGGGGAAAGIAH